MSIEEITTVIGSDVFTKGDLTILNSILIKGTLEGNLKSTGTVIIEENGTVTGEVIAKETLIKGKVNGNVTATQTVTLEQGATLNGDLYTAKVTLAEGSKFNGKCTMIKRKDLIVDKDTNEIKLIELSPEEILTQSQ
ncbi:polymer-forming cytoskeletal protein [candidate division KSB1 bacterium]